MQRYAGAVYAVIMHLSVRLSLRMWHRRRSLWGTEARASSAFRARRHAMERASSAEFLPSNAVRPLLWPTLLYSTGLAYTVPQTS